MYIEHLEIFTILSESWTLIQRNSHYTIWFRLYITEVFLMSDLCQQLNIITIFYMFYKNKKHFRRKLMDYV